jgi:hypothetical protein
MSHAEFSELARKCFVDVAFEDFRIEGKKQTTSRVAVLTGLSRKEVVRLQVTPAEDVAAATKNTQNRAIRVITGWTTDPEFCDRKGNPRPLPMYGEESSFAALIKRYSGDITAGAVLDELVRVGAVEHKDERRIFLRTGGYVPVKSDADRIGVMATCAADLLCTAEHNLTAPASIAKFQREVVYHDVSADVAQDFQQYSSQRANEFMVELNRWLSDRKKRASQAKAFEPTVRLGFGLYYFDDRNTRPGGGKL